MDTETALAICRFVQDGAAMILWGGFGYLALLVPRGLAATVSTRLRRLRLIAVAALALSVVAALPIEAARLGTGWPDAIDPATLRAVMFATGFGASWAAQVLCAAVLVATANSRWPAGSRDAATALAAGALLITLALRGHAVMQEGVLGVAHRVNDAVHGLAAGAWLGALVPLGAILKALDRTRDRADARSALRRFSVAGHAAVALTIGTGVVNAALILGRWPVPGASAYQSLLYAKATIAAGMAGIALVNRYVLVPRLRVSPAVSAATLRSATRMEVLLGAAAVGCVAVLGLLDPG